MIPNKNGFQNTLRSKEQSGTKNIKTLLEQQ